MSRRRAPVTHAAQQEGLLIDPAAGDLVPALPEGTCLLHIGPHKTGTTGLQQALYLARDAMRRQGVGQPGRAANPASAVDAVIGRRSRSRGGRIPSIRLWRALVRDVQRANERRTVISSEMFADAPPDAIRAIVHDLGPSRVHVVVTLRSLARILPSQWQQHVQNGTVASYDRWLGAVLGERPGRLAETFWRRHRHDRLIQRWAAVVGPEHLTVVVLDERDQGMLLRRFEQLLGLARGTLPEPPRLANRSLSMPEVEAVRAFNRAFRQQGLGVDVHARAMTFGAVRYLKERPLGPLDQRIVTPRWALDRATRIEAEMVDRIATSGLRVVGDLETLKAAAPGSVLADDQRPGATITPEVAARMTVGIVLASGLARDAHRHRPEGQRSGPGEPARAPDDLGPVPTYVLLGVVAMRARELLIRGINRLRRVRPPGWTWARRRWARR